MISLVISTIVFIVAAWYLNRYLDEQQVDKSRLRGMLVFLFAYLISVGSESLVDWAQEKIEGPQTKMEASEHFLQLLKAVNQMQP